MKLVVFRKVTGNFVFAGLIIHAVYAVLTMLSSALPLKLRTGLILMTGLVAFLSAVVPQLNQKWDGKIPTAIYFLVILVLSLIAAILLQYFYIKDLIDGLGRSALGITRGILVVGLCWIVCGAPIQGLKRERSLFLLICIMGFLSLSVFSNLNGGIFVSYAKLSEGRSDDTELNHLVVGEAATFLLLLAYAFAPYGWRLLTFSLSIAMLFSLGGRSAFFSYFLAVGLHYYLVAPAGRKWSHLVAVFAVLIGCVLIYIFLDFRDDAVARMLLSQGLSEDGSVVERQAVLAGGLKALPSQILIGDPAFLIRTFRSMGTYIHNILSAWQFFGFLPFLLFVSALMWVSLYILKNRKKMHGPIDDFGMLIFLCSGISILTAKYIGFHMFWFALGFWLFRMGTRKKQHNCVEKF